jgi:integrase
MIDTGIRRAELLGMTVDDVDFDQDLVYVLGKGRRERACPFGRKTAMALDRYVRNRGKLRHAWTTDVSFSPEAIAGPAWGRSRRDIASHCGTTTRTGTRAKTPDHGGRSGWAEEPRI